ncbi:MAG: hypothetical protein R8M45_01065 [Ghiorsea sp.]
MNLPSQPNTLLLIAKRNLEAAHQEVQSLIERVEQLTIGEQHEQ